MPLRLAHLAFALLVLCCPLGVPTQAAEGDEPSRSFAASALKGVIGLPPIGAPRAADAGGVAEIEVATATGTPGNREGDHASGLQKPPASEPSWPRTLVEVRKANEPAKPQSWSDAEIKAARQACHTLLQGLHAVVLPVEPFRDGVCGSPAAVQLVSLGRSPEVAFSPPPVVTCDMVAATANWLGTVQESARRNLGTPLVRIQVMSSYSCRNAYGRTTTRLSEHGRANALDIGGFMTVAGYETAVLEHWGPTARRLAAEGQRPAAPPPPPASAEPSLTASRSIPVAAPPPAFVAGRPVVLPPPAPNRSVPAPPRVPEASPRDQGLVAEGLRAVTGDGFKNATGITFAEPSRLGGPTNRRWSIVVDRDASDAAKSRFLKDIHESACRIFGTVLGPEANRAHENHFHIDMADRRTGSYCE